MRAVIREALTALQRGGFAAAERTLRFDIKSRPADGAALTLPGVRLESGFEALRDDSRFAGLPHRIRF